MAEPSTVVIDIRRRTTDLVAALHEIGVICEIVDDCGSNDVERLAFFRSYLEDGDPPEPTTDVTLAEFVDAVQELRDLETYLDNGHRLALARLRVR